MRPNDGRNSCPGQGEFFGHTSEPIAWTLAIEDDTEVQGHVAARQDIQR